MRRKFAGLSGEGARLYGGRHNPPGIPAIYTAENISLAVLEVLVHLDKTEVPEDYAVMTIRLPARSFGLRRRQDPTNLGDLSPEEFKGRIYRKPVLKIASIIVPREFNYILFPEAPGLMLTSNQSSRWISTPDCSTTSTPDSR